MKRIVVIVALAALAYAPVAGSWTSNVWRSPTRNIACQYSPKFEYIVCETDNDHYAVGVNRYGTQPFKASYRWISSSAPTLQYGSHYTAPGFNCLSSTYGMLCKNTAGHGFFLSREDAQGY